MKGVVLLKINKKKIADFVKLTQGINQTRLKQSGTYDIVLYDQSSFEEDLLIDTTPNDVYYNEELRAQDGVSVGDVVINTMKQTAAIVSKENAGKILSMNFLKVDFINGGIDKRYFVYLFNANKMMKRQKDRETQGTYAVLKIPISSLKELEIPYISLEDQRKIGLAYTKMMATKRKYQKLMEANELLTLEILEQKTKQCKGDVSE